MADKKATRLDKYVGDGLAFGNTKKVAHGWTRQQLNGQTKDAKEG